ncbi:MAG: LysR family transcriptional regulator [Rhizobiales bacterium PAR1]|nr:MAG: LysR family transcriptional regulator [Rhizobiales bacterium PAR1]
MRVDLTSLDLFVTVADEHSIARAAARRNIAASAISKRIHDLEHAYGTPLLIRQSKGVTLTPAGEALLRHVRNLLLLVERIGVDMSSFASGMKGQVRLSANPSAITQFLPQILSGFMARYPDIEIRLEEATTAHSLHLLEDGLADLAIVGWGADHPAMAYALFRNDNLALCVPEDHPLAHSPAAVHFVDTLGFDHVGLEYGSSIQARLEEAAANAGQPIRVKLRVGSFDGVRCMVETGIGVAVLPVSAIESYVGSMKIRAVPLADSWAQRELRLVTRDTTTLSLATVLLREWLLGLGQGPDENALGAAEVSS